ncbi:MAG: hypothetical protein UT91_C0011G0004 [Parcubacteria group bacterium GW2011_GWA2_40_23]|nr:MAG: hypothetical protein UT91_C0011G0004 [Parcubacteria group bacterium GW2011_GWA2_40_23]
MSNILKQLIQKFFLVMGYKVLSNFDIVIDKDKTFQRIYNLCKGYTMTSKEKMYALYRATKYVVDADIPGDFVECGVWRGGSSMLIAHTLVELRDTTRKIFLYDTYEGMAEPQANDYSIANSKRIARNIWQSKKNTNHNDWCYASLDEVKRNMCTTNYPENLVVYVKGKVENTIPREMPINISLLRLDTDWYESTKHELNNLYPILVTKGVLILDDYGTWMGAKKAVDEYFVKDTILLSKIDEAGMIGVKV